MREGQFLHRFTSFTIPFQVILGLRRQRIRATLSFWISEVSNHYFTGALKVFLLLCFDI